MLDITFFLSPDFPLWSFGFLIVNLVGAIIAQSIGQHRTEATEDVRDVPTRAAARLLLAALVFGALGISIFSMLPKTSPWPSPPPIVHEEHLKPNAATPRHIPPKPPGERWERVDLLPQSRSALIQVPVGMRVESNGDPHLLGAELLDGSTCWYKDCPAYADMRGALILNPSRYTTITVYYRLNR